ncbi:hypothetical protein ACS5PU_16740 [Pedobacter sp. GSP4]|uniref:hypothetical protein n=1 Tax=Pedobacter sp. GSP4 TaxID=3453716 RepID=UPI003EEBE1F0
MGTEFRRIDKRFCFVAMLFCTVLTACSVQKSQQKQDWLKSYKKQVVISCMKPANTATLQSDISESMNMEVMGDTFYIREADNLGKEYSNQIQPAEILDYSGKKALINGCLEYNNSKALDDLARSAYRSYLTGRKQISKKVNDP